MRLSCYALLEIALFEIRRWHDVCGDFALICWLNRSDTGLNVVPQKKKRTQTQTSNK